MFPRALLVSHTLVRSQTRLWYPLRYFTTQPEQPSKSWLTQKIESSPAARKWFLALVKGLGYDSPKQLAGRRAFVLYERVAALTPDTSVTFWQKGAEGVVSCSIHMNALTLFFFFCFAFVDCHLPPTFQSWFTITNLHIWLLTVRLRALPKEHGKHHVQALIDHFFIDVEDRIRAVLQPSFKSLPPYTSVSSFYVNPNASKMTGSSNSDEPTQKTKRNNAPDRIVNRQMKIFKEQWTGLGLSFDLALIKGDQEMAAAVWRNLLGGRGSRGIAFADSPDGHHYYRRAVNLVGGEVVDVSKIDIDKEELRDDGSGVHDFPPSEVDKYVTYPQLMLIIVGYIRRELVRLQNISDHDIVEGNWEMLKFPPIERP